MTTSVNVTTLTNKQHTFAIDAADSCALLKAKIQDTLGIPPDQQVLWFQAR